MARTPANPETTDVLPAGTYTRDNLPPATPLDIAFGEMLKLDAAELEKMRPHLLPLR